MDQLLPLVVKGALLSTGLLALIKLAGLLLSSVIAPVMAIFVTMRITKGTQRFLRAHGEAAIIKAQRPEKFVVVLQPRPAANEQPEHDVPAEVAAEIAAPARRAAASRSSYGLAAPPRRAAIRATSERDSRADAAAAAGAVFFNHRNRLEGAYAPPQNPLSTIVYGAGRREARWS